MNLGYSCDDYPGPIEAFLNRAISMCNEAHIGLGAKGDASNIKIFQLGNDYNNNDNNETNSSSRRLPRHLHFPSFGSLPLFVRINLGEEKREEIR